MNKRKRHDYDDGFDEESLFEDEEFFVERIPRRPATKTTDKTRKHQRDRDRAHHVDKSNRHRELASMKAWGTPY